MRFCTALAVFVAGGVTFATPAVTHADPPARYGLHVDVGPLHFSYGSGYGSYGYPGHLYAPYATDCYRDSVYLYRARPYVDYFWGHDHRHGHHRHDLYRHGHGRYDAFSPYVSPYRRW